MDKTPTTPPAVAIDYENLDVAELNERIKAAAATMTLAVPDSGADDASKAPQAPAPAPPAAASSTAPPHPPPRA